MSEPIHERHRLNGLAQAHLISQDDIVALAPVVGQEIQPCDLELSEHAVFDVRRLLSYTFKFPTRRWV